MSILAGTRRINNLCDLSLLVGSGTKQENVSKKLVEKKSAMVRFSDIIRIRDKKDAENKQLRIPKQEGGFSSAIHPFFTCK